MTLGYRTTSPQIFPQTQKVHLGEAQNNFPPLKNKELISPPYAQKNASLAKTSGHCNNLGGDSYFHEPRK